VAKSIKVGLEAGFIFIGSSYIYIKKKEQRKEKQKDTGQTETRFDPTCRGGARKNKLRGQIKRIILKELKFQLFYY
jgi:hypothetical protein